MYFRSQKKLQGEVSLSETIESDREGNALQLMDDSAQKAAFLFNRGQIHSFDK